MTKLHFLLPIASALLSTFFACSEIDFGAGCAGSETTNGIVAMVDGEFAPYASVALRKVDYRPANAETVNTIVQADAYADSNGRFNVEVPDSGDFRLTVVHHGFAYSKVVSKKSIAKIDSVTLTGTSSITGLVEIPEGSNTVWIGVLGTDILVQSDSNGSYRLPSLPSNESLELYVADETYNKVVQTEKVELQPFIMGIHNFENAVKDTVEKDTIPTDTVETDTVKKITVMLKSKEPATYASVTLREASAIADTSEGYSIQNTVALTDTRTDAKGQFTMEWPAKGDYRLTISDGSNAFTKVYAAKDFEDIDTLMLEPTSTISSRLTLKGGESYAWVGIYGLDIFVKTGSSGEYVLPNLPATDSLTLYFLRKDNNTPKVEWTIKPIADSTLFLQPSMMLQDFEGDISKWYFSIDTVGSTRTPDSVQQALEIDEERNSTVFHGKYKLNTANDYCWVLVGTQFDGISWNLSELDSVEFYAKGSGSVRVAIERWDKLAEEAGYSVKAASEWIKISSSWKRIVVRPNDLCKNTQDNYDCSSSWEAVKEYVRQIHIFAQDGSEFYIDDVKLYGALF